MPAPARFFVRVYKVDPAGEGPDDETVTDAPSAAAAKAKAKRLRRTEDDARAFERRNIRHPEFCPAGIDPPAYLWEWEEVPLDADA